MKKILLFALLLLPALGWGQFISYNLITERATFDATAPDSYRSPWQYSRADSTLYRWNYTTLAWEDWAATFGGATNLSYTASAINGTVTSDTGTDATIPPADGTNAGLLLPGDFTKLAGIEAGATADQTGAEIVTAIDTELGGAGWKSDDQTAAEVPTTIQNGVVGANVQAEAESVRTALGLRPTGVSGTLNRTALWTSANTLGNSYFLQSTSGVAIDAGKFLSLGSWTTLGRPTTGANRIGWHTGIQSPEWHNGTAWFRPVRTMRDSFTLNYIPIGAAAGGLTQTANLQLDGNSRMASVNGFVTGSAGKVSLVRPSAADPYVDPSVNSAYGIQLGTGNSGGASNASNGIAFSNTLDQIEGPGRAAIIAKDEGVNEVGGSLRFFTHAGGGGLLEALTISNAQEIGINNTTPQHRLDVNGVSVRLGNYIFDIDQDTSTAEGRVLTFLGGNIQLEEPISKKDVSGLSPSTGAQTINLASKIVGIYQVDCTSASSPLTLTINNPVNGGVYTFHFQNVTTQDITFPAAFYNADGTSLGTLTYSADDFLTCYYDGSDYYCK